MSNISGSVGIRAVNCRHDVKLVQQLLNRFRKIGQFLLRVDGHCGPRTISAIEEFQKEHLQFQRPDGIIHPHGPTIAALSNHNSKIRSGSKPSSLPIQSASHTAGFTANDRIAWGAKVSPEFKRKLIEICKDLDMPPDFLMAAIAFESAEKFSPSVENTAGSGAVGLIQFMPKTAEGLGTSTELLSKMSAVEQLDYVKAYFKPYAGKLQSIEDVYMAILYPAAIGTGSDHVLFKKGSISYTQNKGLDGNHDGKITVGKAASKVRIKLDKGLGPGFVG